jgi:hypothetical protein
MAKAVRAFLFPVKRSKNCKNAVKEILAAHFDGKPITRQNLCRWRQLGFQRWRTEKQDIDSAEKLGEYAGQFTKAAPLSPFLKASEQNNPRLDLARECVRQKAKRS